MTTTVAGAWTIALDADPASHDPGLRLDWAAVRDRYDASARAFWKEGLAPWGLADAATSGRALRLPALPTLDDVWTLFLVAGTADGRRHPSWEAMVSYCADVRQGFLPDRVAPDVAVQAIYRAIVQSHLLSEPRRPSAFVEAAWLLCRRVAEALERGDSLLNDPILGADPDFTRFRELLGRDHASFVHDLARARRFVASLPPARGARARARPTPLLVLDEPSAVQFKAWARVERAVNGVGYSLLLVRHASGEVVLSVDPATGVRIGWLAEPLTAAEAATPGAASRQTAWYDGRDHGGTLVASPKEGTGLTLDAVLATLRQHMTLRPERRLALPAGGARVAVAVLSVALLAYGAWRGVTRWQSLRRARTVIERYSGNHPRARYALVVGVCSYTGGNSVSSTCRNARRFRDVLVRDYGYRWDRVRLLVDEGVTDPAARCTANNIWRAVEDMGTQIRHELPDPDERNSTFVFFYSGHGAAQSFANSVREDDIYGQLEAADYYDEPGDRNAGSQRLVDRAMDVRHLRWDLPKSIPSAQRMIILDACNSGTAVMGEGSAAPVGLEPSWEQPTEFVLTSASANEQAVAEGGRWDGLSVFTYALLQGLRRSSGYALADDSPREGVITDEELARYVQREVPRLLNASSLGQHEQRPMFRRFGWRGGRPGQFVFVGEPLAGSARPQSTGTSGATPAETPRGTR